LAWARKVGGSGNDDGKDIGVDANGNVYITGTFESTADFDPSSSVYNLTSNGGLNIFLAKYNSNGLLVWANSIGNASFDYGNSLSVSNAGVVTIAGSFSGNVDFDPSPNNTFVDAGVSSDPFFARYNTNGKLIWVKDIAGSGESAAQDIFIDPAGGIYITGSFFGTSDFDPGAGIFSLTGTDAKDIFYAKYNANGKLLWADRVGGTGDQAGLSITADSTGNVYATGYFQGTIDFDPGAAIFNISSPAFFNAYLLKLNNNGSFGWVKNIGGPQDDIGFSVAVDAKQNVYTAGYFNGTVNLGASTTLTSAGSTDIYVVGYNAAGKLLFANQSGGVTDDWASALATDANGFVYLTGYYTGTATFDFQNSITLTSAGNADVYISKFRPAKNTVGFSSGETPYSFQKTTINTSAAIDIFPNPVKDVMHLHIKDASVTQILIMDVTGNPLKKMNVIKQDENISLSAFHTGTYLVRLYDKSNRIIGTAKIFKD
jgi:Secretion system C-terminal sorting domain/Beta-propeller repeat